MPSSAYDLKYFLSILMLLPTRYLQAKGIYCTKRDSFSLVKESLPEAAWSVLDYATQLRSDWPYSRSALVDRLQPIPGLLNVKLTHYIQDLILGRKYRPILNLLSARHLELSAELAQQMFDNLYADEPKLMPVFGDGPNGRVSRDTLGLAVVNHPVYRTLAEYQEVRERFVNHVKNVPSVMAVYEYGSVTVPGLSDLDFIVCLSDRTEVDEARLLSITSLPFGARSLILHNALIIPEVQIQSLQELLIVSNLQKLWGRASYPPSEIPLVDAQTTRYAQMAKLIEKLFAYKVWSAEVVKDQVLDARWAIAVLKSLVYSVSLVESLTDMALSDTATYSRAVNELRAYWFDERSLYRKNLALCGLFLLAQDLTESLITILDEFLTSSGWLQQENVPEETVYVVPLVQSKLRIIFRATAEQTNDLEISLPAEYRSSVILPWSFFRIISLYAHYAPDLAKSLTIKIQPSERQPEMPPQTKFEKYLHRRALQVQTQTRFLLQHNFWFGSYLPEQLLHLPDHGQ
jgi:hypothetical protein